MSERRVFHPVDAAKFFASCSGQKYRPSNGTEGEIFYDAWCQDCRKDEAFRKGEGDSCLILAATMCLDVDDEEYPKEWLYGADGQPKCTAFEPLDGHPPARCDATLDLFGGAA
jgi:hypothetical protein